MFCIVWIKQWTGFDSPWIQPYFLAPRRYGLFPRNAAEKVERRGFPPISPLRKKGDRRALIFLNSDQKLSSLRSTELPLNIRTQRLDLPTHYISRQSCNGPLPGPLPRDNSPSFQRTNLRERSIWDWFLLNIANKKCLKFKKIENKSPVLLS